MIFKSTIIFLLILKLNSSEVNYKGDSFPLKYLEADDVAPKYSDIEYYLQGINKMLGYIAQNANDTGINRALGMFYIKALLKRTVKDNSNKIQENQRELINSVILQADNIMSHFYYNIIKPTTWADPIKRVAELFREEDHQIEAIGNFNRHRLRKWLLTDLHLNDLAQDMDELKLTKEEYIMYTEITMNSDEYTLGIYNSDYCMGEIIYNPKPHDASTRTLQPCVADEYCSGVVYDHAPSFAYSLSHRMLNVMFPRHIRRCYMRSPEEDDEFVDILCSSMYRETVYIARRGYFSRDMWMEHIALCSIHGYEEFHRRHWFRKVVSWIDEQGCIAENFNYDVNRTRYILANENNPKKREKIRETSKKILATKCHFHPMALGLIVLAHGVRHAVHFSEADTGQLRDEL